MKVFKDDFFIHLRDPAKKMDDEPADRLEFSLREFDAKVLFKFLTSRRASTGRFRRRGLEAGRPDHARP
jgi:hypothetical protein